VTNPAVAANVHEPLDVHRDLGAQRAPDAKIFLIADAADSHRSRSGREFSVQLAGRRIRRCCAADTEDVGQTDSTFFSRVSPRQQYAPLSAPFACVLIAL
jgi:hypothetical protein